MFTQVKSGGSGTGYGTASMATYGYLRADEKPRDAVIALLADKAREVDGSLATVFLGDDRQGVAETIAALKPGDVLVVPALDHLGASMADLAANIKSLGSRGVRLYTAVGTGSDLELPPEAGATLLKIVALWGGVERAMRSRQARERAQSRKRLGLAYCRPPMGKRIVERNGAKLLVWDQAELRRIAEVARRLPIEGAETVAKDFWRRGIRDSRGRLWGKQKPKPFSRHRTPLQSFLRAHRKFWRWYWAGELPEPYASLAASLPEPSGFREEARRRGWTAGGTTRRERAERKALRRGARHS